MKARAVLKSMLLFIVCLGILIPSAAYAQAPGVNKAQAMFYKANELFQQGNYEQAKKAYADILSSGIHSGNIYYNLGNSFFKLGQIGRAIVNYERAKRTLPQDSDVQANLQYALSLCNNSVVPVKQFWLISIIKKAAAYLTLDAWTIVLSGVYFLCLFFAAGFILTKKAGLKRVSIWMTGILVCVGCIWFMKFQEIRLDNKAIIIVSEIDSRFAPAEDAVIHFKAYEGAAIDIIDRNNSWVRIKTPDGKIGWVPDTAVEKI